MRRAILIATAAAALLASFVNPHFAAGGAYDFYGPAPWWQPAGAFLCLIAVAVSAAMIWRRSARLAFKLVALELTLYVAVSAASALSVRDGYFSNGWGGSFLPAFLTAIALRLTLLYLAHRMAAEVRTPIAVV